jgi:hypothetical protein
LLFLIPSDFERERERERERESIHHRLELLCEPGEVLLRGATCKVLLPHVRGGRYLALIERRR